VAESIVTLRVDTRNAVSSLNNASVATNKLSAASKGATKSLAATSTAAPTVSSGPSELANAAPNPLAAVDVAAKDFVAPLAFLESDLVACEVLFKEDIAFLASTLKVTILSAT